ncbi:hypothetical protein F5X99DRAFT_411584 [Biscogniauxia marginata]|nr:hypothetical protein F5X99DRAFT_411584 [Biscogniauxia marginata]
MTGARPYSGSNMNARLGFMVDKFGSKDPHGRLIRRNIGEGTDSGEYFPIIPLALSADLIPITIREQHGVAGASGPGEGLCHCNIIDKAGNWCGSIVLARDWIADKEGKSQLFITISDAKSFTADECPVWNYYIPKEKDESEWDLYHVLLLERHRDRRVFEESASVRSFKPRSPRPCGMRPR